MKHLVLGANIELKDLTSLTSQELEELFVDPESAIALIKIGFNKTEILPMPRTKRETLLISSSVESAQKISIYGSAKSSPLLFTPATLSTREDEINEATTARDEQESTKRAAPKGTGAVLQLFPANRLKHHARTCGVENHQNCDY